MVVVGQGCLALMPCADAGQGTAAAAATGECRCCSNTCATTPLYGSLQIDRAADVSRLHGVEPHQAETQLYPSQTQLTLASPDLLCLLSAQCPCPANKHLRLEDG